MGSYNIVNPTRLTAGQLEDVGDILANLQAIQAVINGGIDNSNLAPGAAIAIAKLAGYPADSTRILTGDGNWASFSGSGGGSVPAGCCSPYAADTPPIGWMMCDGAAISRTTYSVLFGVIGTVYGTGDNSTTFNLPDLRGRFPVGKGTHGDVNALAANEGVAVGSRRPRHRHTLNWNDPGHAHGVNDPTHAHGASTNAVAALGPSGYQWSDFNGANHFGDGGVTVNAAGTGIGIQGAGTNIGASVGPQSGAEPVDTPAFIVVNWIIKT